MARSRSRPRALQHADQHTADVHPLPIGRQQHRPHRPKGGAGPRGGPASPGRRPSRRQWPAPVASPRVLVTPWPDPVLDAVGHDPRSPYVETFWLSILGPSALVLLRKLAAALEREPGGFPLDPVEWAAEMGLGNKGGPQAPFWRSLDRVCRFGAADRNGELLAVRRRLAPLTSHQEKRLPVHLRPVHQQWQAAQMERPRRRTIAHWSDHSRPPAPQRLPAIQRLPAVDRGPAADQGPGADTAGPPPSAS